jgi:Na+/H+-translocating membrane pyrophosphatase
MYEATAGRGLGVSSIAIFGRVGGSIYTTAADAGTSYVRFDRDAHCGVRKC